MRIVWKTEKLSVGRLARVVSVLAIAMGAGHVAQTVAARRAAEPVQLGQTVMSHIVLLSAGGTEISADILNQPEATLTLPMMPTMAAGSEPLPLTTRDAAIVADVCGGADLSLAGAPGAMMAVALAAPCHAGERVVLSHAGLAVTGRLDERGALEMAFPALVADARLAVTFANGTTVAATLAMPEAEAQHRFGVQWRGGEAFAVHGFENGADFGQPGHVWANNRGLAEGGMLSVLGDATVDQPLLAQIYTYPAAEMPVEVMVEAAVTPETCGRALKGDLVSAQNGLIAVTDLTLAMPDCSAVGQFLVLKNLVTEMKLAAN